MNIFILSECPVEAAQLQCDKHIVKMPTESAQMLSVVHRMLDGVVCPRVSKTTGLPTKRMEYVHPTLDDVLYKTVHENHPCTVWTTFSSANYDWHYRHFVALCEEYTYRYGKIHSVDQKLRKYLQQLPKNIKNGAITPFPLAMKTNPECMFSDDPVKSYRMFYQTKRARFKMSWKNRQIPEWFIPQ